MGELRKPGWLPASKREGCSEKAGDDYDVVLVFDGGQLSTRNLGSSVVLAGSAAHAMHRSAVSSLVQMLAPSRSRLMLSHLIRSDHDFANIGRRPAPCLAWLDLTCSCLELVAPKSVTSRASCSRHRSTSLEPLPSVLISDSVEVHSVLHQAFGTGDASDVSCPTWMLHNETSFQLIPPDSCSC
jgi:hypothetical protein